MSKRSGWLSHRVEDMRSQSSTTMPAVCVPETAEYGGSRHFGLVRNVCRLRKRVTLRPFTSMSQSYGRAHQGHSKPRWRWRVPLGRAETIASTLFRWMPNIFERLTDLNQLTTCPRSCSALSDPPTPHPLTTWPDRRETFCFGALKKPP